MPHQDFTINPMLPTQDDKAALLQQTSNRLQQSTAIIPASQMQGRKRSKRSGNYIPAPGTGSRHARDFSVVQDEPIMRLAAHTHDVMHGNPPDPFKEVGKRFGFNR